MSKEGSPVDLGPVEGCTVRLSVGYSKESGLYPKSSGMPLKSSAVVEKGLQSRSWLQDACGDQADDMEGDAQWGEERWMASTP